MELSEALDIVAARFTPRFRELCDPKHPDFDAANIPIVFRLARGESPHPPMPVPRPPAEATAPQQRQSVPSLVQKAANFAVATVQHVAAGMPKSPEELAAERLAICGACDRLASGSCSLCGCQMKIKVTWADQKCPIGKW